MPKIQSPAIDLGVAEEILSEMESTGSEKLIPILQKLQEAYGYLPVPVLKWISKKTGIHVIRIYGVIPFYTQFHIKPHGRHVVRACEGTACHVKGSHRICEHISQELGVEPGGTTKDMRFTFETIACLGTCFLAPVMMVDNDYYGQLRPDKLKSILSKYE